MNKESDWIIIGRFGRPHGLKGLVRVISFAEPEQQIFNYSPWFIKTKESWSEVILLDKIYQHNQLLVLVKDVALREEVAKLTNLDIGIQRAQLPPLPKGEYYWHELIGMSVITHQKVSLGIVVDMMATGSNDVLIVQGDRKRLIPYLMDQVVLNIDHINRHILVDWDVDF